MTAPSPDQPDTVLAEVEAWKPRRELTGRAYRLASEIEWTHAKDRAQLVGGNAMIEYDPHAATELGAWIEAVMIRDRHAR